MKPEIITELEKDIQRLISELKMGTTAYNVEAILGKNGKLYILELGARSGGSLIPQITELATGVNMVKYVIKAALGRLLRNRMSPARGYWSNYMLHSKQTGRFKEISFDENFAKNNLVDCVTRRKMEIMFMHSAMLVMHWEHLFSNILRKKRCLMLSKTWTSLYILLLIKV